LRIDLQKFEDKKQWQLLQMKICQRDNWACVNCGQSDCYLHIHFKNVESGKKPWEYPEDALVSLCEDCLAEERKLLGTALNSLSEAARSKFLASQIHDIACSMSLMKLPADPETISAAISLWLKTPKLIEFMINIYNRKLEAEGRTRTDAEKA
jgi:hypothetical protein